MVILFFFLCVEFCCGGNDGVKCIEFISILGFVYVQNFNRDDKN